MKLNLQIHKEKGYILSTLQGLFNQTLYLDLLVKIIDSAKGEEILKVFIDVSELSGHISIIERYKSAEFVFKLLNQKNYNLLKIVIFGKEPFVNKSHFGENVAVNRGILFKSTTDFSEALNWLEIENWKLE